MQPPSQGAGALPRGTHLGREMIPTAETRFGGDQWCGNPAMTDGSNVARDQIR